MGRFQKDNGNEKQIVYRKKYPPLCEKKINDHAMLRKYEKVKNHVEVLMAEEDEEVSLPETNKREQSTETKEAVRTMKRKKKHHGMEL